ncbi:MAG TPA: hypothetical protein ENI88_15085, partial [Desulfobulbus sp.]|nr:hypothetical protein [Desulfobulbus sp.]
MHLPRVQKKFLNNKWALAAAGTGLFTLVVLLLLPVASKYYLTKWLLANGADTAVIEKIRINPFAGSISLEGVDVTRDGDTVLSNTDISFNLSLMALFQKEADIEKAALDNLTIEIELYKDGRMRFGSYTTSPPSTNAPAAPASTAAPWTVLANQLNLSNCRVRFKMPDLDMTLQVDEASLNRFTTAPGDKSGSFSLNGSLNGTPISLKLNTLRVEPDIVVQGSIQIDGFKLNGLANILKPYLNPFTGKVSADGTVLFKLSDNGDMS